MKPQRDCNGMPASLSGKTMLDVSAAGNGYGLTSLTHATARAAAAWSDSSPGVSGQRPVRINRATQATYSQLAHSASVAICQPLLE